MSSRSTILIAVLLSQSAFAKTIPSNWKTKTEDPLFIIDPSPYLNRKQKKLIYSGFPAYSAMSLIVLSKNAEHIVKTVSCAIEYDLWDEKINLLFSSEKPNFKIEKSQDYFDHCLSFALNDSPQIRTLLKGTSQIKLRVSFTQISGRTNSQITSWLVQQQSTVLKGLFSHMLGELKLEESQDFEVVLPENKQK